MVIDASVVVDAILHGGKGYDRFAGEFIAAPHLIDAEVGHALRKLVFAGAIDADRAGTSLIYDAELEISRYPHVPLLQRAWELRNSATFYDALYIALAESLGVPLVTFDRRMAGIPGTHATVEVLVA